MKARLYTLLLILASITMSVSAQDVIGHSTKKCSKCGKPVASCPYKGNHPVEKCKTCGKALSSCQYRGNHPVARCSECGKTISSCPYSGRHPKKASYISVNGYSTYDVSAASSGQTVSIRVSTDGESWSTWGVPSWCYITNKTSSGFTLNVQANNGSSSRSDYMTVNSDGKSARINITQKASSSSSSSSSSAKPTAQIKSVTVDHNQMRDGVKSMVIHVKFDIQNAKGHKCAAIAYFHYANGNKLMDTNGQYKAADGQCSARTDCNPGYDNTTYSNLEVIMPNSEIESSGSGVELKFKVEIYDFDTKQFVEEEAKWFEFTK